MIDHYAAQLALRTKLKTLEVCTTGSVQIAATTTGYTRATGSFLDDGFRPGMEVGGADFSNSENNDAKTATAVTALAITASGCVAEAAGARTLTVALPAGRAWENIEYEPVAGTPYVEEAYLPGPTQRITLGSLGEFENLPAYEIRINTPAGSGVGAPRSYAKALVTLFAPSTSLSVTGSTLIVRGDVAPHEGQLLQSLPGFATVPVTVPLRFRSANAI